MLMLEMARKDGATHVSIVDCDEILTANLLPTIRQRIEALQPGGCLQTGMLAMWRSLDRYRVGDSIWANRFDLTLAFCDRPDLNWAPVNGYDHHSRAPHGSRVQAREMGGGVMHLQWASWRRLVAKHAKYQMDERLRYPDKSVREIRDMYSLALEEGNLQLADAPAHWWAGYGEIRDHIDLTAEPWQEQQCRDWMAQYGAERFKGLDLFGVV